MAIDTRARRAAAAGFEDVVWLELLTPDGTISTLDRETIAGEYPLAVAIAPPVVVVVVTPDPITVAPAIIDRERTINLYPVAPERPMPHGDGDLLPQPLMPCPGMLRFATLPTGPVRGVFTQDDRVFAVGGQTFYEISSAGTVTVRGTVAVDAFPASMASNGLGGHQVFLVSGDEGYIFDLDSGVFTHELSGCRFAGFVDGYFLALDVTTSTLKLSALEDGTTWDPLDIAQRSTSGDKWVAMVVCNGDVWLTGSQKTDVWRDTGNALFPFEPIGGVIQYGCLAPFSLCVLDDVPHWIGGNEHGGAVWYRGEGYSAVAISSPKVDRIIQSYRTVSDAVGFVHQSNGHPFAVMNFETAGATWVYDAKTQQFHERAYWDPMLGQWDTYRPQYHAFAFGTHLVGDHASGDLFELREDLATEVDGEGIRRLRRFAVDVPTDHWVTFGRFTLVIEPGLGRSTGQGSDPQGMLRYSNDGAKTWGPELWRSLGRLGQYTTQVYWNRSGRARGNQRVFEYTQSDPTPCRITQATVRMG